ncbi:16S rRNA (uracil(1498)-N(3))-methyltransferase [Petrotoga sp. 9PWA.NaAc.5.4]|uniref:16S rRNA (uracil(1498)-N(3))-methyltransferase n=1 Tax=Petrotoga sp. 9PWA.NaAc.5.4 TaxID=1434328 RepID=UPI000CC2DB94|nr:16S rRNA (uracil(1498)-N(3))-methyltransferase [Petrotoga sp. 9PWA.NaAc.5.4]PNR92570.1 hypothetical protein X924_09580 [Petrotoga sp. 9PWA.NaAc.5.4]
MPNVFYGIKENNNIILDERETAHLKVLRKIEGDLIKAITGDEFLYYAKIQKLNKKKTISQIVKQEYLNENYNPYISIYFGMSKWDRTHLLLEKLVELRVNEFNVFKAEKSETNYKSLEKFQRTIIEACKQTVYAKIPSIKIVNIEDIPKENTIILDLIDNKTSLKTFLQSLKTKAIKNINVVLGPDTGFSENEKDFFITNNFEIINLGKSILRFETSAIYVVTALNYEFDRLNI